MSKLVSLAVGIVSFSLLIVLSVINSSSSAYGLSDDCCPPSPITARCGTHATRSYSFDWDYQIEKGDHTSDNFVIKNKNAKQDTVNAEPGCGITVEINNSGGDDVIVDAISAFMSKGKIKTTDHNIKFDKTIKMKVRFGYSHASPPEIGLTVPKLKSGT